VFTVSSIVQDNVGIERGGNEQPQKIGQEQQAPPAERLAVAEQEKAYQQREQYNEHQTHRSLVEIEEHRVPRYIEQPLERKKPG